MHKIKHGEASLSKAIKEQKEFKNRMGDMKKVPKKIYYQGEKRHEQILKTFMNQDKLLLIFMVILLKEHLKLDIRQDKKEKELRYQPLKKCFKDCQ